MIDIEVRYFCYYGDVGLLAVDCAISNKGPKKRLHCLNIVACTHFWHLNSDIFVADLQGNVNAARIDCICWVVRDRASRKRVMLSFVSDATLVANQRFYDRPGPLLRSVKILRVLSSLLRLCYLRRG